MDMQHRNSHHWTLYALLAGAFLVYLGLLAPRLGLDRGLLIDAVIMFGGIVAPFVVAIWALMRSYREPTVARFVVGLLFIVAAFLFFWSGTFAWGFRDGLKPGVEESTGFTAIGRCVEGCGPFVAVAVILCALGAGLTRLS